MGTPLSLEQLTRLMEKLGASDPESWASSQIKEGKPQLQRFLFLREAWRLIVPDGDPTWLDKARRCNTNGPGGGIVAALDRILAAGATAEDLTEIVRVMQWKLLSGLCQLIDEPDFEESEVSDVDWALFLVDAEGNPTEPLGGLHESVLETEPSGREMFPKSRG